MSELTLSDFLAHYENPDDVADYQYYYSRKKEFAETRGRPSEKLETPRGGLYTSQLEFLRFLREANDTCILMADPGTGKTCQLVALAEYFRTHPGRIKHVFFLTGGPQIDDFKRQLACICTVGVYDKGLNETSKESQMKSRLTRNIGSWYTATTYGDFVKELKGQYRDPRFNAMLKKKYSGCIFFFDEVQKVKMRNIPYNVDNPNPKIPARVEVYAQLWRIMHLVSRSIKIIASARIVENYPEELGFHMNLVNPLDRQIYYPIMEYVVQVAGFGGRTIIPRNPLTPNQPYMEYIIVPPGFPDRVVFRSFDIDNAIMEDENGNPEAAESFRPYLNGKVFYVRALDTGIIRLYPDKYILPDGTESQIRIRRLTMSKNQQDVYLSMRANDTSTAFIESRQAITWVYPDGTWNTFSRHIRIDGQTGQVESINTDLTNVLENGEVAILSAKAAYVCRKVAKAWAAGNPVQNPDGSIIFPNGIEIDQTTKRIFKKNGKIYVFTEFDYDGGAYQLGLALQYGIKGPNRVSLTRYVGKESSFELSGGSGNVSSVCSSDSAPKSLKDDFRKRVPRYAIITSDNQKNHSSILEMFNSPENINGDLIKIIIITPVGQVGLNLTETSRTIQYNPFWKPSQEFQGTYRAFRATSHVGTMEQAYAKLRFLSNKSDESDIHVSVHVDPLACVILPEPGQVAMTTIDEGVAIYTEQKDRINSRLIRICKRWAVNKQTQELRNIRPGIDQDGSPECDYMQCSYKSMGREFDFSSGDFDYSTYNVYYMDEIMNKIIRNIIIPEFRKSSVITAEELYRRYYSEYGDIRYFYFALAKMINERIPVINRFGFEGYVREDNKDFSLSLIYPRNEPVFSFASNFYTQNLIAIRTETLSDIARIQGQNHTEAIWARVLQINPSSPAFSEYIGRLGQVPHMYVLEYCIQQKMDFDSADPHVNEILRLDVNYFKILPKPEKDLYEAALKIEGVTVNSAAGAAAGPIIAIHKLYNPNASNAGYGRTRQTMNVTQNIRVYENGIWRDTSNDVEESVYKNLFKKGMSDMADEYKDKFGVFGFYARDDDGIRKFVISDNRFVGPDIKIGNRKGRPGRVAITFDADQLYQIMWFLAERHPNSGLGQQAKRLKANNDKEYAHLTKEKRFANAVAKFGKRGMTTRNEIDPKPIYQEFTLANFKLDEMEFFVFNRETGSKETISQITGQPIRPAVNKYLILVILECFVEVDAMLPYADNIDPRIDLQAMADELGFILPVATKTIELSSVMPSFDFSPSQNLFNFKDLLKF